MTARKVVLLSVASSLMTLLVTLLLVQMLLPGWRAHLSLEPQIVKVRLPEGAPVQVAITEPIETELKTDLEVAFPIDETLPLHFAAPLTMNIEIDTVVPMQTVVRYEDVLPLNAEVTARILGIPFKIPVSGQIPIKLFVPIDQDIPVRFSAPVKVSMDQPLEVPVKLDFRTTIPLDQAMSIPVTRPLETNILMSDRPVAVEMTGSDLVMPLDSIRLERKQQD